MLRLKGSGNLKAIQVIKIAGGLLEESFLDEGFLLNKKVCKWLLFAIIIYPFICPITGHRFCLRIRFLGHSRPCRLNVRWGLHTFSKSCKPLMCKLHHDVFLYWKFMIKISNNILHINSKNSEVWAQILIHGLCLRDSRCSSFWWFYSKFLWHFLNFMAKRFWL